MPFSDGQEPTSSTAPFAAILNAVSDAVLTTDAEANIRWCNRAATALLGYSADEMAGMSVRQLLPRAAASRHDGHIDAFAARGYTDLTGVPRELTVLTRTGEERHVELILDPLPGDGQRRYVAILRDLSMRDESLQLAEEREKLARSEARFRDFAECGADWFWEIDQDLRFTYMSPQVEEATGYPPEWHVGKTRQELGLDDGNAELMENLYFKVDELEEFYDRVQVRRRRDGGHVWIAFSGTPVLDADGNFAGYRGVSRDVTKSVEREKALKRSNRDLENFAYAASHDLQEPLRKIVAFGESLQEGLGDGLDELNAHYLSRMTAASKRMSGLIDGLLDFARVGRHDDPDVVVDLSDILDQVISDLELSIAGSGATVERGPLPRLTGQPTHYYQLLLNLIANALKFRDPNRPPEVRIDVERRGEMLFLRVSDNGIGFDNEHAGRIFELFGRLHGRDRYEGTGLGLALCKKIVEHAGGSITATGIEGEGAVFTVALPAVLGKAAGAR
ncbi:MAG: sensor histidine kinase [Minwuia sp.]|uniref:sensor histidine kinase n=1 Tax=Minwuia sp. TaxID=2493630 RepID=UPI003A890EE0